MKQPTVRKHPLAEVIAKKLFGITGVPANEQKRMVNRAIKAAVKWHEENISKRLDEWNNSASDGKGPYLSEESLQEIKDFLTKT